MDLCPLGIDYMQGSVFSVFISPQKIWEFISVYFEYKKTGENRIINITMQRSGWKFDLYRPSARASGSPEKLSARTN